MSNVLDQIESVNVLAVTRYQHAVISAVERDEIQDLEELLSLAETAGYDKRKLQAHVRTLTSRKQQSDKFAQADQHEQHCDELHREQSNVGTELSKLSPFDRSQADGEEKYQKLQKRHGEIDDEIRELMRLASKLRTDATFVLRKTANKAPSNDKLHRFSNEPFIGDPTDWKNIDWNSSTAEGALFSPTPNGRPELPPRAYGEDKIPHLKYFSVDFYGFDNHSSGKEVQYARPVRVLALDESDAWSQVVGHYRLDGSRFKSMVTRL